MGNKNRSVRIALARIYGSGCMFKKSGVEDYIEKLGNIKTYKKYKESLHYKPKKIEVLEEMMSLHHLKHKSEGGRTDEANGAIINILAHQYMHSLPRSQEEIINDYIREWKKFFMKRVEVIEDDEVDKMFNLQAVELSLNPDLEITPLKTEEEIELKRELNRQMEIKRNKEKRKEKREFQKIKKEYEDR